ncbi:endonuclease/exonuclease/phosphatase family protein [Pseudofrankia sp. DC12]|uniref:endonuclease/exonuclease/phosphatase family protein n=1 Tax=Pseudofrankia sp. DC12 TaxID=683315 RepID=UPI0005F8604C|nr:endonuclease/exonuclease/phosphatase family protein [Pseudofrankia sp. DC12]
MRLGTFNLMHGRSMNDETVDPVRFRSAVASLDCDVLALQEVDLGQPRSGGADLCALAAEAIGAGPAGRRFAATVYGTPGESWRPATGPRLDGEPAYGIALVSRLPVRGWRVMELGRAPVRAPVAVPGPEGRPRLILLDDEPRAAIIAELATPDGPLTVAATHLSFVPGWNARQVRRLVRALGSPGAPAVVLGDLNLPGPLPTALTGWRRLAAAPTYPAHAPRVQFDHVLGRGPVPRVVAVEVRHTPISDHRALVVDLA